MILIEKGLYKFKTNWFDLEEYSLVSNFDEFFKEEISEEIFRIYLGNKHDQIINDLIDRNKKQNCSNKIKINILKRVKRKEIIKKKWM